MIDTIDTMKKHLEEYDKKILNGEKLTEAELFFYIGAYADRCRINLQFNPFSPWNKQHNVLLDKMNKEFTKFIDNLAERFNLIKSSDVNSELEEKE